MGATQPYVWTIMVFLFLGSPLVLVTILSHAFRLIGPSKPELMFFAVLPIIGFLIPLGWVFRRVRYRQSEWIISGSGVLIRDIGDRFVPWHQVEAVFYGPDFVRILLIRRTASLRSPPFFHNRAEAARIANEMDARRIQAVAADPTRIRPPTAFRHD